VTVIELVLTPRHPGAAEAERLLCDSALRRRWDDSDEVCQRLLAWLREEQR